MMIGDAWGVVKVYHPWNRAAPDGILIVLARAGLLKPVGLTSFSSGEYHLFVKRIHWPWVLAGALVLLPGHGKAWVGMAFPPGQGSEEALEDQIRAKLEGGEIAAAADQARDAVARYPNSAGLEQLLGAALFKLGANEPARAAFHRAIELDPSIPQNYYDLALIELSEGRDVDAVAPLRNYLRLMPKDAEAHLFLGRALHNDNQTVEAIAQFKTAIALNPRLPLVHYHLGYAYQSQGEQTAALAEFQKEIADNPKFYDAYWLAGKIVFQEGNYQNAAKFFRQAIALKPDGFEAHYGLGQALAGEKDFAGAETEFKKALILKPESVEAHYALARLEQEMGKKEEAQREFEICTRLNARTQNVRSGIAGQQP